MGSGGDKKATGGVGVTSVEPSFPGGVSPHESDGDACRLAKGCKLQIMVSLRVFRMESQNFYPYSIA